MSTNVEAQETSAQGQLLSGRVVTRVAVVAAVVIFLAYLAVVNSTLAVMWLFGLAFGAILQRSRLCFASGFRDIFLMRDASTMRALAVAIGVATIGFWLVMQMMVPEPSFGALPAAAHVIPIGLHLVVGGVAFGFGMVIAGGCVSGTMYRIGEGYVTSWASLAGILAGLYLSTLTWNWWWTNHISDMPVVFLPKWVGYGGAVALTLLALSGIVLLSYWWEYRSGPMPNFALGGKSEMPPMSLGAKLRQVYDVVFVKGWPIAVGAIALAVVNVFIYIYSRPLGVTGELSAWSDRIASGLLRIQAPALLGVDGLAGCNLTLGTGSWWTSEGLFLDGGLIIGALVAALLANEFKVRVPPVKRRYVQSVVGGIFMGYGAGIAIGCTIGAFFSAIPSLGLNGWVFGLSLLPGAYLGVQVIKRIP